MLLYNIFIIGPYSTRESTIAEDLVKMAEKHQLIPKNHYSEEFALGIVPKSLHTWVLMQTVYNAVIWHSGEFLKHVVISVVKRVKIMVA